MAWPRQRRGLRRPGLRPRRRSARWRRPGGRGRIRPGSRAGWARSRDRAPARRGPRRSTRAAPRRAAASRMRRRRRWRARRTGAAARNPWAAATWRTRLHTSGSWLRSHSSLGAVKPGRARLPVSSISRRRPTVFSISRHSAAVRWSFQRIAGRRTRSAESSATRPCIWPREPDPVGRSGAARAAPAPTRWLATSPRGPARPSPAVASTADSSASARASTDPCSSIAMPLTPEVPTSIPTRHGSAVGTERGVDELVGAHRVLGLLGFSQRLRRRSWPPPSR